MKRKFTLKQINWIVAGIVLFGGLIGYLGALGESTAATIIGVLIMFGGLALHIAFYRCPHCNSFLGRSGGPYCRYCGKNIEE